MRHPSCWGHRPAVMGVINLTPDSFSDGGRFNTVDQAVREASRQIKAGADVLDLGAQSTRPGAVEVGADEELKRLLPCLQAIRSHHPDVIISVDTNLAAVASAAEAQTPVAVVPTHAMGARSTHSLNAAFVDHRQCHSQ